MFSRPFGALLLVLLLISTPLHAQRNATIPDPDPEIEKRSFIVDPRFEVNLYAADPLLAKPIHMNFDAAGRLWIASSEVYPQIKPGQKANDKIIVLEDSKGVGVADKTTVFADGLLIPTGLLPGDGGVYVANSTELIHLSDTKGTGKADKRRVVLSGFGTEDTHHMLHTLRWGPDGRMYMMQSIYIHSHIETPHGPRRLNAGGIWRFKPETMELDIFARGWVNAWGLAFDRYGQAFVTDGAGGEGINYVIPGGYYVTAADAKRVFPGLNPGSPKFCGLEIVSGRHLPDDWQGNLITNDFRGHRVCRFIVKDDGAGFASTEQPELIKSTHPAFRPIDVKMGPDGAIYIADWYNPIIQHGEVDFRDPRRDVTHGRIWRVTAKGRPLVKKPKIEGASKAELLEALKAPEQWTRDMARRQMVEMLDQAKKPEEREALLNTVNKAVSTVLRDFKETFTGFDDRSLVEMIMLTQSLDDPNLSLLKASLLAKDQGLRALATRSFYSGPAWAYQSDPVSTIAKETAAAFDATRHDLNPRVRLERVRGAAKSNDPAEIIKATQVLKHPMDRFLDYALWLTVRDLEPVWLPEFRKGKLEFNHPRHQIFAVQASGSPQLVEPLLNYLQTNRVGTDEADVLWGIVAQLGGPKELQILWEQCLDSKLSDDQRLKRLQALEVAARDRKVKPGGDLSRISQLIDIRNIGVRNAAEASIALRLTGLWKNENAYDAIVDAVSVNGRPLEVRKAAIQALAEFKDRPNTMLMIAMLALNDEDRSLKLEAVRQLVRLQPIQPRHVVDKNKVEIDAHEVVIKFLQKANEAELREIISAILQTKGAPEAFAKELSDFTLPPDVAKTAIRIARSTGQVHQPLIDALAKAGKLNTAKWEATPVVMKDLLEGVAKEGNAPRGELIYRRKELNCLKCHGIGGSGGQIGPDMTSIGASAQPDYLIESLLLPSKAIKENFNTTVVSTVDGKVLTGIKQRENKDELILRDAEGNDVKILIKDIEGRADGKSLMPEGLVDSLTRGELVDLVRFLTELGKVGNYSVGTTRIARTWETLVPNAAANEAIMRNRLAGAVMMPKGLVWSSEYATVGGLLPLDAIPDVYVRKKGEWSGIDTQIGFARTKLEVGTAGEVLLSLNDTKGVQMWLDQQPVDVTKEMTLKLSQGSHVLTLAVNKKERSDGLRVELKDVAGSAAQGRWVLGR